MAQIQLTHTISQNCHCEICCGMHLTRQNTSITPDRNESVRGPEKISRSYHRHSHCSCQIETVGNILYPNDRHAGSRLSWLPWQKTRNWKCRYVYTPMLSGLRWPGQTVIGSWPPANCNEEDIKVKPRSLGNQIKQVRSSTFLQMVHTHTHPWARKYNERLPVAREDMRKPSVHSAIRKSRTSRIKQRIRSERCFASFASCSSCSKTFLSGGCKQRRLKKIGKAWERLPPAISMVVYLLRVCPRTTISLSLSLSIALSIM